MAMQRSPLLLSRILDRGATVAPQEEMPFDIPQLKI